jgi:hypothetical protein
MSMCDYERSFSRPGRLITVRACMLGPFQLRKSEVFGFPARLAL